MLNKIILKFLNLPAIFKIRFSPAFNLLQFRLKGLQYGSNVTILGGVSVIGKWKNSDR